MAIGTGMLLRGRYRVGNKLGENAVGATFEAVDSTNTSKVVVKEIRSAQVMQTYDAIRRCGNLDGIVNVIDVFNEGGSNYAVTEFVTGMTLETYFAKSNSKFNVQRVKDLLNPVLSSLVRLSEDGIVHGNISADNFIFTNQGKLKLIGFGCTGGIVSQKSRPYAAPEMYNGTVNPTEAADVYALAATVYRCITGIIPPESALRRGNDTCQNPSAIGIQISPSDESAIMAGMNPNPGARTPKLSSFYRALYNANMAAPQSQPQPAKQQASQGQTVQVQQVQPRQIQPTPVNPVKPQGSDSKTEIVTPLTPINPAGGNNGGYNGGYNGANNGGYNGGNNGGYNGGNNGGYNGGYNGGNNAGSAAVPPINTNLDSHRTPSKKKKNSGSPLLIVLIVLGIVVAVVLGIVVYGLATGSFDDTTTSSSSKKGGDDDDDESDEEKDEDYETELAEIEGLLAGGQYEDTIQSIIDNEIDEEDGLESFQTSVDNLYSQCVNEANALADSGDLDTAYTVVDNRISYFEQIKGQSDYEADYHDQDLQELRDSLESRAVEYYKAATSKFAAADDEESMLNAYAFLNGKMDEDERIAQSEQDYYTLITVHMTKLSSAKEKRDYIEEYRYQAGNDVRLLELWDFYDNQYYSTVPNQNRMTESKVNTTDGYVIKDSNSRLLSQSELSAYTEYELYFAVYEIYARYGLQFSDGVLTEHFSACGWYTARNYSDSFDQSQLTSIEKENVNTILNYCNAQGYRD